MQIFVNRALNMKKIKAIGLDMDHTLVRYHSDRFEEFTYYQVLKKLAAVKKYPEKILELKFHFEQVIQGLVIDKKRGNLLKISRYGKVKQCAHGIQEMPYKEYQSIYSNRIIDLNDSNIQSLDTYFAISNGVLFSQLVSLKDQGLPLPRYDMIADDIKEMLDLAHSDGTLKNEVKRNIDHYIIKDPQVAQLMERLKRYGKSLLVITNSDFNYCKMLMEYAIDPFLKDHTSWRELFDFTITFCSKPGFFTNPTCFLKIDPETGLMSNLEGPVQKGVYQGGWSGKLQMDLGLEGDEILYVGDHIYGDVVSIKKTCNWRTALVLDPLQEEIEAIRKSKYVQEQIDELMNKKELLESTLNDLDIRHAEKGLTVPATDLSELFSEIENVNKQISALLDKYRLYFNPQWGGIMRAGQEESRFADQVEKYACIYMTKISDLLAYSPKTYFRPMRRVLPHEIQ